MANVPLKATLTLNNSAFQTALRGSVNAAGAAASKIEGRFRAASAGLATVAAAVGVGFSARALAGGVNQQFEAGRALQILSRQTGASVRGLVVLQDVFRTAGLGADGASNAMFRLQKSIAGVEDEENKGGAARLESLGLDLVALQKLSPDQQLLRVGHAIAAIHDPARRTAAAMQIFGKAGKELGAAFNAKSLGGLSPLLGARADLFAKNAEAFEQVVIRLERFGDIGKTFFGGAAGRLAPALTPLLDRLERMDLTGFGERFGDGLAAGAAALGPMLKELQAADLPKIAEQFGSAMKSGAEIFAGVLSAAVKMFKQDFKDLASVGQYFAKPKPGDPRTFGGDLRNIWDAITGADDPAASPADQKTEPVQVNARTSMFKTDGMKWGQMQYRAPTLDYNMDVIPPVNHFTGHGVSFGDNVFDETRGGALEGTSPFRQAPGFTGFDSERDRLGLESGLHSGVGASLDALGRATNAKRAYTGAAEAATVSGLGGGSYGSSVAYRSAKSAEEAEAVRAKNVEGTNQRLDKLNDKMDAYWGDGSRGGSQGGGGATATK